MNQISDAILLQCLEQLEDGHPVESILARFSEYAGELRPILESTRRLEGLSVDPPPAVQQRAKAGFLAQAAAQADGAATRWTWPALRPRWLVSAVALMLVLLFVGAMVVPASASAVPGDMLYGTKRAVEQWRLLVAAGPERQARLTSSFHQERLREIAKLLATGRDAEVSFDGTLQSVTEQEWTVDGLPIVVGSATVVIGSPWPGMEVRVTGRTQEGELLVIFDAGAYGFSMSSNNSFSTMGLETVFSDAHSTIKFAPAPPRSSRWSTKKSAEASGAKECGFSRKLSTSWPAVS